MCHTKAGGKPDLTYGSWFADPWFEGCVKLSVFEIL